MFDVLAVQEGVEIHSPMYSTESRMVEVREQIAKQTEENLEVLQGYDELIALLMEIKTSHPSFDLQKIVEGISYSAERHQSQTRKNQNRTPYIIHPMGVARQIIEIEGIWNEDILLAALLHDVIEDTYEIGETEQGYEEIRFLFGEKVEEYVRELSDDKSLPAEVRKELQIEHASHKSFGAAAVKLSDKLYNLNDLMKDPPPNWSKERIDQYLIWAQRVIESLPSYHPKLRAALEQVFELI